MPSPERYHSRRLPKPSQEGGAVPRQPDVLTRLEQAVGQIQDSETFRAYLDVQARFHRYSWSNVALILAQKPDSTMVAGYNAWLRMHRYVRRGEKAIKIIVPMIKKVETEDGQEERKLFFSTGNVFDISATDGEPLPEIAVPVLEGEHGQELYQQLERLAQAEGLQVQTQTELTGEKMGYYDRSARQVVLRQAAPLQMTKTLAHELAHHFGGHEKSDPETETIAESCAYVVCSHFGLDTGERSFPYVAVWAQEPAVLRGVLTTVQQVSAKIIDGIEGPKAEDQPELA